MKKIPPTLITSTGSEHPFPWFCAIHCEVTPVAATILPLVGIGFLADKRVENVFLGVSLTLDATSVCWGVRVNQQRRIVPLFVAVLTLILAGRATTKGIHEVVLVVLGAVLLICGHLLNYPISQSTLPHGASITQFFRIVIRPSSQCKASGRF